MKTSKKQFGEFCQEFRKWQEYFGLMEWEVTLKHRFVEGGTAECTWNIEGKNSTVSLSTQIDREEKVGLSAFHEAAELWLVPLRYLARARFVDPDTMAQEFHAIIRFLENRLYPLVKEGVNKK